MSCCYFATFCTDGLYMYIMACKMTAGWTDIRKYTRNDGLMGIFSLPPLFASPLCTALLTFLHSLPPPTDSIPTPPTQTR